MEPSITTPRIHRVLLRYVGGGFFFVVGWIVVYFGNLLSHLSKGLTHIFVGLLFLDFHKYLAEYRKRYPNASRNVARK